MWHHWSNKLYTDGVIAFQDKSLAKVSDKGERQVSALSAKSRGKITAHYNNKLNLIKLPYVKPYESTYITNRPIEDPVNIL